MIQEGAVTVELTVNGQPIGPRDVPADLPRRARRPAAPRFSSR
jgi:hypothetical protein